MRKNWTFRAGLALFVGIGLVFPSGSPIALGIVSVACIGCLLVGLFKHAMSELGIVELLLFTLATCFLIVVAGRALFVVVESLTRDTSADVYVGNLILTAWAAAVAALIYGIIRRIRKRKRRAA